MTADSSATSRQQTSGDVRQQRTNTLSITRKLESALASAAYGRESAWHTRALEALGDLQTALQMQREVSESSDGLFAQIAAEAPRLTGRIQQLEREYSELERSLKSLRADLLDTDAQQTNHVLDVRDRVASLLDAFRRQQDKETELVFEAYGIDIGVGD